ncbi:MAG: hypothetical protein WC544_02295 [Patescibacteria group bacterium]
MGRMIKRSLATLKKQQAQKRAEYAKFIKPYFQVSLGRALAMSQKEFRKWYLRGYYRKNKRKAKEYQQKYNKKKRQAQQAAVRLFKSTRPKQREAITQHVIIGASTEKSIRLITAVLNGKTKLVQTAALQKTT